jgi:hypothetical protein
MGGSSSAGFCCAYASPSTRHGAPLRTEEDARDISSGPQARAQGQAQAVQAVQAEQKRKATKLPHASQGSMPERESQARAGAYWRRRSYVCRRAVQIAARARARGSPRTGRPAGLERSAWPGKGSPRSELGLELRRRRGCFVRIVHFDARRKTLRTLYGPEYI